MYVNYKGGIIIMKNLSRQDLEKILNEDLQLVNGRDFFKTILIEQILNRCDDKDNEEISITETQLENAVDNLMDNDTMWQEIDNAIAEELAELEED